MHLTGKGEYGYKAIWTAALTVILMSLEWILLVAGTKPHEMIVGGLSVLASGAFLVAVQRTSSLRVDFRMADLATCWRLPWYVISGVYEITIILFKDLLGIEKAKSFYRVSGFKTGKTTPQNDQSTRSPVMNPWLLGGVAVSAALIPCADMSLRGTPERRLVGLEMTSIIVTVALIMFTVAFGRTPFIDLPLALAILSFGGGLVFARFLEKHL